MEKEIIDVELVGEGDIRNFFPLVKVAKKKKDLAIRKTFLEKTEDMLQNNLFWVVLFVSIAVGLSFAITEIVEMAFKGASNLFASFSSFFSSSLLLIGGGVISLFGFLFSLFKLRDNKRRERESGEKENRMDAGDCCIKIFCCKEIKC